MREALNVLAEKRGRFAALPFFRRLEGTGTLEQARAFMPRLTFFVLVFQDILRVNESHVTSPVLRQVARRHRVEDDGHEGWFLADMRVLATERDLGWVFGPEHAITRDAAYALMSEVHRAEDDLVRILLLEVLEATGDAFFSRVPGFLKRSGPEEAGRLHYFSERHHRVESEHSLFDSDAATIAAIALPPAVREQALAMMDRSFAAMTRMVADFEASMVSSYAPLPSEPGEVRLTEAVR